ncbi:hypothetical protein D3C85_1774300 [compost metagenome]
MHKPGDEKRSLVIVSPDDYDDWLVCKDPELARTYMIQQTNDMLIGLRVQINIGTSNGADGRPLIGG